MVDDTNSTPKVEATTAGESPVSAWLSYPVDRILSGTPTDTELQILSYFRQAIASGDRDIDDISEETASNIDQMCPSYETLIGPDGYKNVEAFLWQLWSVVLNISRLLPHNSGHPGQDTIVMVIRKLRKIERGTVIMWGAYMQLWDELPLLNQSTIESTGSPATKGEEAPSENQVQQWCNESAFNARCLQSGAGSWDNYAMRALASALESDDWPAPHLRCEILAATQWLIYSSPTLIRWAKENDENFAQGEVVNWERDVQPGPLFHGREGLSVGRWNFWKERLESLLQSPPDHLFVEDVHGSMSLALERMKIAEKEDAERPEDVESGEVGIPNESGD